MAPAWPRGESAESRAEAAVAVQVGGDLMLRKLPAGPGERARLFGMGGPQPRDAHLVPRALPFAYTGEQPAARMIRASALARRWRQWRFQLLSGLNFVIFCTAAAVSGPRSFSNTTPSWLTMKVITPEFSYDAGQAMSANPPIIRPCTT